MVNVNEFSQELIDSQGRELGTDKESFKIKDDKLAEWALRKISEIEREHRRIIDVCQENIDFYTKRMEEAKNQQDKKTSYFRFLLMEYFETVPKKKTKTQETYLLPSGKLKRRFSASYEKDDKELIKWAKENAPEYIKVEEKVDWSGLKSQSEQIEGGSLIYKATGELIEGVKSVEKPAVFTVEINL